MTENLIVLGYLENILGKSHKELGRTTHLPVQNVTTENLN